MQSSQIQQLSIFIENRPGRLADVTKCLKEAKIDIIALSLADTSEFGILRLIVDKHNIAEKTLIANGFTVNSTTVLITEVEDSPGALNSILEYLKEANINIEYMYGFHFNNKEAVMVFRFDNSEKAIEVLKQNNIKVYSSIDVSAK